MLDRDTIEQIEELHAAVVRAEAEQRFGLLRGKRTRQVAEAEAAEQAYLNAQGFATYNDFRLRIRRSTVFEPDNARAPWEQDYRFGAGVEAHIPPTTFDQPAEDHGFFDSGSDAEGEFEDLREVPQEGSDEMATAPDSAMSQPHPAIPAFAPDQLNPPIPPFSPEAAVSPMAPPPVPQFVARAEEESSPSVTADLRRLTEPLFATLQAETDRYVAARIEAAEKQAAEIVARASREGAEVLGRASRMHDAVRALLDDALHQAESFMGHTEELSAHVGQARQSVAGDLQALRELVERSQGSTAPNDQAPPWSPPTRVAPPPVSAVGSTAGD